MNSQAPAEVVQKMKAVEELVKNMAAQASEPAEQAVPASAEQASAENASEQQQPPSQPAQDQEQPTQSETVDDLRARLEAAENRYRTLAGMIHVKDEEIRRLQELIAQFADAKPNDQQPQASQGPDEQKDIDEFGADMVDMVKRVVSRALGDVYRRLAALEQNTTQAQQVMTETRKERFERRLTELVPNWREIDVTPEFGVWLKSSNARLELAQRYMADYNAEGIAELFQMYMLQNGMYQPKAADTQVEQQKRLEKKVAPAKSVASAQQPVSSEKKTWTRTEIAEVYRNRRSYDAKTFAELEREIAQAQREGRVDFSR